MQEDALLGKRCDRSETGCLFKGFLEDGSSSCEVALASGHKGLPDLNAQALTSAEVEIVSEGGKLPAKMRTIRFVENKMAQPDHRQCDFVLILQARQLVHCGLHPGAIYP
ncbi:hypothetical protein D9M70_593920 [compost metagenome]